MDQTQNNDGFESLSDAWDSAVSTETPKEPAAEAEEAAPLTETPEASDTNSSDEQTQEDSLEKAPEAEDLPEGAPEELQQEYDKRIKGYQAAYTKKIQSVQRQAQEAIESFKTELRAEFESKFRESVPSKESSQSPKQQPNSLDELFQDVPKEQVALLERAIDLVTEKKLSPLREENERLKSYVNRSTEKESIQTEYQSAVEEFPELSDEKNVADLRIWAEANPERVKNKSIRDMWIEKTYHEQKDLGYKKAMEEMKRKQKQQLESSSGAVNVLEKDEDIDSLENAFQLAVSESMAKNKS